MKDRLEAEHTSDMFQQYNSRTVGAYPRVLIVNGEPIAALSATGITLSNLFGGWPLEKLAQVVTSSLAHEHRVAFEYQLRADERRGLSWVRAWMDPSVKEDVEATPGHTQECGSRYIINTLRSGARKWLDLLPYELPYQIEKAIAQFRPDIVYTCLGNIQISALALGCAKLCQVSIIPHFLDSWMSTMYAGRPDLVVQRRRLISTVQRVIGSAPVGMAISDLMAAEYTSTYGVPFHTFMNCTSVTTEMQPESPFDPAIGPRLVYVGGLHLGRWRSLKAIGETLACVNSEGIAGKLYVYAPAKDIGEFRDKLAGPCVEIVGSLAPHEVPDVLRAGHVMVHVESFEKRIRRYTRLSMSTKIPQYLAAGRPLLCYGPSEIASCRFIKDNECGLVASSQKQSELILALRTILSDVNLRRRLARNAWIVAQQKFDTANVRSRFHGVIAHAVWESGIEEESLMVADH